MNGKKLVRGTMLTVLCMVGMLYWNSSVSKAYTVVVSNDKTNVRNSASISSEVMTVVNAGDRLEVFSEEQDSEGKTWYKVSINNVSGYVRSDTVKKESEAEVSLTAAQTEPVASTSVESMPSQAATVNRDDVNVRSSASTKGSVVAKLKEGAAVTLTGTSSDSEGKKWYQVNFINNGSNVTGYIRDDFVNLGEVVETTETETPEGEGETESSEDELAAMYGDMPTENGAPNNDYELFFEPDQEGVECWYVHDNTVQKRYKLEQLLQADEMNTHNLETMDKEIEKMRMAVIVLAVLFVFALLAAGFFGFKYHDLKDDEDDDDEDDDDDDFREAPPVRRRSRKDTESAGRSREAFRDEERAVRSSQRRSEGDTRRRTMAAGAQRRTEAEGRTAQRQPQARRTEAEMQRRPSSAKSRSPQSASQIRRAPMPQEKAPVRNSARGDVEWKSKNFLAGDHDELDYSFMNMDDDV